ncbi:MAG: methyl-accepting chemotaxis protein [Capsulimonadaceae bacterium]|nr:methyl-accepting chemotaxis protein [Capsulimonadaceae bacterium]
MNNLKIPYKLFLGFGICIALGVLSSIVALHSMASMGDRTNEIVTKAHAEAVIAGNLGADFRQYRVNQLRLIIARDPNKKAQQAAKVATHKAEVAKDLDAYSALATEPSDRALLLKMQQIWQQCLSYDAAIDKAGRANDLATCDKIINSGAEAAFADARETCVAMTDWNNRHTQHLAAAAAADAARARLVMYSVLGIAVLIGIFMALMITKAITDGVEQVQTRLVSMDTVCLSNLQTAVQALAHGDLTVRVETGTEPMEVKGTDEIAILAATLNSMVDKIGQTVASFREAQSSLGSLIAQVRIGAEEIASASGQLASGNEDLASRTVEQAASLEETAASMAQMTSSVKNSAEHASEANRAAIESKESAGSGGEIVKDAITAMRDIDVSSKRIVEIVSVIDEIAFQTNLLALNASVEAARVGEHGKGFAVVAAEVRNLASRSSTAAKEIKTLVKASVASVEHGTVQVNKSGEHLREIVSSGERVAAIVEDITTAAQEQAAGIEEVNKALCQMDEITQQNAALVEEAASASEEMSQQARELRDTVRRFKIQDGLIANAPDEASRPPKSAKLTGTHGAVARSPRASRKPVLRVTGGYAAHDDTEEF